MTALAIVLIVAGLGGAVLTDRLAFRYTDKTAIGGWLRMLLFLMPIMGAIAFLSTRRAGEDRGLWAIVLGFGIFAWLVWFVLAANKAANETDDEPPS